MGQGQPAMRANRPALADRDLSPVLDSPESDLADLPPPLPPGSNGSEAGDANDGRPPSLASRFRRPETLVSFALAIAIVWFFARRLEIDPDAVWANVRNANIGLLLLAVAVFYLGFIWRAWRWRRMLAATGVSAANGYNVPGLPGLIEIFLLSWFGNCVVPAKLGDAYRGYLLKRDTGASFSTTLGTILAERLIDLGVLFATMALVGLAVFGRHVPGAAGQTLIGGLALLIFGMIGLAVMWWARNAIGHHMPHRIREQYVRLHDAVFACLRRPASAIVMSVLIWVGDGLRLYFVALALGADLSVTTATFIALMGALLTTLPITPAGLGIVDVGMIGVLKLVDVETSMAGSIVLLDRVIGYWSIILIGLVLYGRRMKRDVRVGP